jgi:hypothetical protein
MKTNGEAIRRKAYELWEMRGRPDGSPEVDWLAAELLMRDEGAAELTVASSAPERGTRRARYGLREIREG